MGTRLGLGPVFAYEWLTTSRRWQVYAARSALVGILLVALLLAHWNASSGMTITTPAALARIGEALYMAIVGTQLALVLLAAPAATAGAICLDKVRGTLTHLLVTDLSDGEIVLGKLAARLVPVVGCVGCVLPVMALGMLLGGLDPQALIGAMLITMSVAVFGSALAFTFSVWSHKTHEVLLATYAVWAVWLLAGAMTEGLLWSLFGVSAPVWLSFIDPFHQVFAAYTNPGTVGWTSWLIYSGVLLLFSALLAALSVLRLRAVAVRQLGRGTQTTRKRRWRRERRERPAGRFLPGPSLDRNPVLWREWHRRRPSRWTRVVWGLFIVLSSLFSLVTIAQSGSPTREFGALVNAFQVTAGLLLVCVAAPTALAEERVRGSLDVLMSTPLPTRSILWGKWWGAYRLVPLLAVWPFLVTFCMALTTNNRSLSVATLVPVLTVGLILTQGAFWTSLGLALATWISRLGRALAVMVSFYVFVAIGWVMLVMMLISRTGNREQDVGFLLSEASPFWGTGLLTVVLEQSGMRGEEATWILSGAALWIVLYGAGAIGLWLLTLMTFDRLLGRVSEEGQVPRPAPFPTKKPLADPDWVHAVDPPVAAR